MKKCFTILGAILLGFIVLLCMDIMLERMIQSVALETDESSYARSEAIDLCGQPQDEPADENQDIDEPPLTWSEAHCAPKSYRPPEALVPDRWHPANALLGTKP